MLKPFGIRPKVERVGNDLFRGYEARAFDDPFSRYSQGSNPLHPLQPNNINNLGPNSDPLQTPDVTDTKSALTIEKEMDVTHVTDKNPEFGGEEGVTLEFDTVDGDFEARGADDVAAAFGAWEAA